MKELYYFNYNCELQSNKITLDREAMNCVDLFIYNILYIIYNIFNNVCTFNGFMVHI